MIGRTVAASLPIAALKRGTLMLAWIVPPIVIPAAAILAIVAIALLR
jgi:hypothetical protein